MTKQEFKKLINPKHSGVVVIDLALGQFVRREADIEVMVEIVVVR